MKELLDQIPTGYWAVGIIAYLAGAATVWRFARYVERLRDAIRHARHHATAAKDFAIHARNNVAGFLVSGALVGMIFAGVGFLAYLRFAG